MEKTAELQGSRKPSAHFGRRFRVWRLLGRGGMGAVYLATDTRLKREVAIKTLDPGLATGEGEARFWRECKALAALGHPNIVRILDADVTDEGVPYLVMERLSGESLDTRLAEGALRMDQILKIADEILAALGAAHAIGILHRDVKPGNIFLARHGDGDDEWSAKLLDFGLARSDDLETVTLSQGILGTPSYMAPEQALGDLDQLGPQTDLWALGVVLYQMISGHKPFAAKSLPALTVAICEGKQEKLDSTRDNLPPGLTAIVDGLLVKDPRKRIADARAVRTRLAGLSADSARSRYPGAVRRPWSRILAALAIGAAAGGGFWWYSGIGDVADRSAPVTSPGPPSGEISTDPLPATTAATETGDRDHGAETPAAVTEPDAGSADAPPPSPRKTRPTAKKKGPGRSRRPKPVPGAVKKPERKPGEPLPL